MQITILGTSAMLPTKERNPSAVYLSYKSEGILFDCGEGTQRQMKIAGLKIPNITKILLTHWHGDHVLGLPGLVQTMSASEYQGTLEIFGPVGVKKQITDAFDAFHTTPTFQIKVTEVKEGIFF